MFARGWACLHTAPLPVPKNPAAKPCVFITSKLIEIKGLQLHYFGHLRKTGGRGSYRLVHSAYLPLRKPHGTKSNHSRTYEPLSRNSNDSHTYAKTGGGGRSSQSSFLWSHLVRPFTQKCRRADIFDFSPYFSHFSCPERSRRVTARPPARLGRRPLQQQRAGWPRPAPTTTTSCPLSVTSRQYLAAIAWDLAKTEPRGIPAWSGSPRCGYVPFAYRCPDAHD